jgi:hypothetical protein
MKGFKILLLTVAWVFFAGYLQADIYEWTDKNGIKHFTNYKPPDDATILIKSEEMPYDEAADRARIEADKQYQLELARLELAEREAELERREADAERKVAEAERYADDTVRAADQYLDDSLYDRWYYRSGSWGGYHYGRSRYSRSYYRNHTTSIYWKDRSHNDHYRHNYRKKSHYRYRKKYHGQPYRYKTNAYPHRYRSSHNLRSNGRRTHSANRVNSRSRGQMGRSYLSRASFGHRR